MHYLLLFSFIYSSFGVNAQVDTSKLGKLAFSEKKVLNLYNIGDTILLTDDIYKVWKGDKSLFGFYNENNEQEFTIAKYDTILYRYFNDRKLGVYLTKLNNKWGLLKDDKSAWINPAYDKINFNKSANKDFISIELKEKYGILSFDGLEIIQPKYDEVAFDGYRFLVKNNDKWGLFNEHGKNLIPPCFDQIFHHEYINQSILRNNESWSLFNWIKDNPCNFSRSYDNIESLLNYYVVRDKDKFALLNIDGKEILPFDYDFMAPFFLKYLKAILVGKDKKVGVLRIDSTEKVITAVPIIYDDIWIDEESFKIKVKLNDKIDYYFNDQTLFDFEYNDLQYYPRIEKIMVKKGSKWGMVDVNKREIIPINFSKIHILKDKQFLVQKGTKWGLYNDQGRELIPAEYDEFDYRPEKDFFFIKKNNKWGIISTSKGLLLPPKFEDLITLSNKKFLVKVKGLWGIAAPGGSLIIPAEFSSYKYKYKSQTIILIRKDGSIKKYNLF